ncbi:hypothetical protein [Streptomyces sp. NPDC019937]|uniref:hypothetical protein n=1 Tax=Streptomyces sp. NPDC019937 TaxID=3154787 RepID=UPI0033C97272
MRKKLTKAAVVLAGLAAVTGITMGSAQAEVKQYIVPDQATCLHKGDELTDGMGPVFCSPLDDGTGRWLLEIG